MARIMSLEFVFGMIVERTISFGFCRSNARTASSASCAKDASTVCPARACLTRSMYFGSYSTTSMDSDMECVHYKSLHHRDTEFTERVSLALSKKLSDTTAAPPCDDHQASCRALLRTNISARSSASGNSKVSNIQGFV